MVLQTRAKENDPFGAKAMVNDILDRHITVVYYVFVFHIGLCVRFSHHHHHSSDHHAHLVMLSGQLYIYIYIFY